MALDQPDDRELVVSGEQLAVRRARYFMDQQIALHGTIVSIALGVAGLAAASLFEVRAADRPYHLLMWMLWVISLLGVGVVYSGMTVSVYVLPSVIPGRGVRDRQSAAPGAAPGSSAQPAA